MVRIHDVFETNADMPAPELTQLVAIYEFRVPDVGRWWAVVDKGVISITGVEPGPADCTMIASEEEMLRIFSGEQNLITALMQGRVEVEGNVFLAQRLHGYIRAHGKFIVESVR